jgi:predicted nucleic acid-binding protein
MRSSETAGATGDEERPCFCGYKFPFLHLQQQRAHRESVAVPASVGAADCHLGINEYEIQTALRYTEFLGDINEGQASVFIAQFERDVLDGRITIHEIDLPAVFARAKSLAASYTTAMGARSFDLLHIASALELGAEKFLTFDRIQQKVAMAEGLKSPW